MGDDSVWWVCLHGGIRVKALNISSCLFNMAELRSPSNRSFYPDPQSWGVLSELIVQLSCFHRRASWLRGWRVDGWGRRRREGRQSSDIRQPWSSVWGREWTATEPVPTPHHNTETEPNRATAGLITVVYIPSILLFFISHAITQKRRSDNSCLHTDYITVLIIKITISSNLIGL